MAKPIFRIFKLGLDLAYADDYAQVAYNNLANSIEKEPGTLAMYANHLQGDKSKQIVVELYADDAAYQEHAASAHFKSFAGLAAQALTSRQAIALEAQALLEKEEALRVFKANELSVRLAHIRVSDSQAFAAAVLPEMQASMAKEEGVLVMYAGVDSEHPDTWYFFEIYQDEAAYEAHRETSHFKDYIEGTADLVLEKDLQVLTGDLLVNRGSQWLSEK